MQKWTLNLQNLSLGGYCPGYWKNSYSSYGNSNQSPAMVSIDMTDPNCIKQGPDLVDLDGDTNPTGTIKGIIPFVASANKTYGISATKIYDITATAIVEKDPDSPITGGEDITLYGNKLLWSHDTDIGIADNPYANANENWWTTVASGAALTSGKVHQLLVAGTTGLMTILNGSVVASWDGTTATDIAFDTQDTDIELISQIYCQNRFYFAGNKPNTTGRNDGSVFVWDGNSSAWDYQVKVQGKIGALFAQNGIPYIFYQKNLSDGVCTLGYIDGAGITDITNYYGSLPSWYQVAEYKNLIIWASGTALMAWGADDMGINTRLFKLGTCGAGGLSNPFGTPITAADGHLYKLSGYATTSSWYSMLFDLTGNYRKSHIDKIKLNFDVLETGARVDLTLKNNKGTSLSTKTISYTTDGAITTFDWYPKIDAENMQIQLNYANGSTSKTVAVRNIKVEGHYLT